MWRAALALLVATGTACGKQTDDGPAVVAGAPAGTVVAIDGVVTAGARTLAKGDAITADDEIATGEGAHVTIELAHNRARWSLGPKRHEKPRDAPAWRLAKADGSADSVHATATSAGRDGERSAADTDISTPAAAAPPAVTGGEPRTPAAPAATTPAQKPEVEHAPKSMRRTEGHTAAPPAPPALQPTAKDDDAPADLKQSTTGARRAPTDSVARATEILGADTRLIGCLKAATSAALTVHCEAGRCKVTSYAVPADRACVTERVTELPVPLGTYDVSLVLTILGR